MPSFDVVSEVNLDEVHNGVNQATREINTRFDFKGKIVSFELEDGQITMRAPDEFQLSQMYDILASKLASRKVNVRCLQREPVQVNVSDARQIVTVRQGIETDLARQLVKTVKQTKMKVQVAIQGDRLRVTGKKRDDLQQVIALLKETEVDLPLQYINFRSKLAAVVRPPVPYGLAGRVRHGRGGGRLHVAVLAVAPPHGQELLFHVRGTLGNGGIVGVALRHRSSVRVSVPAHPQGKQRINLDHDTPDLLVGSAVEVPEHCQVSVRCGGYGLHISCRPPDPVARLVPHRSPQCFPSPFELSGRRAA